MGNHFVMVDAYEDVISIRRLSGAVRLTMAIWDDVILVGGVEIYDFELVRVSWPWEDEESGVNYMHRINIYGDELLGFLMVYPDRIEFHPTAQGELVKLTDLGSGRRVEIVQKS